MTTAVRCLALPLLGTALAIAAPAHAQNNFTFSMVTAQGGVEGCLPKAAGRVTISTLGGLQENMHVEVTGLPKKTDFDFFVIQSPVSPFGLSWYMGDMLTDGNGEAVADFVGRFNVGTFIVAPGVTGASVVPMNLDDASKNPATAPVQLYHVGLWFDTPQEAAKAGCADKQTPFNSTHNAGVQALNTSQSQFFPLPKPGPLFFAP